MPLTLSLPEMLLQGGGSGCAFERAAELGEEGAEGRCGCSTVRPTRPLLRSRVGGRTSTASSSPSIAKL